MSKERGIWFNVCYQDYYLIVFKVLPEEYIKLPLSCIFRFSIVLTGVLGAQLQSLSCFPSHHGNMSYVPNLSASKYLIL